MRACVAVTALILLTGCAGEHTCVSPASTPAIAGHSDQQTSSRLAARLYRALVVEPARGSAENRDYTVIVRHLPNGSVAVNGAPGGLPVDARPGETVRLRVINVTVPGIGRFADRSRPGRRAVRGCRLRRPRDRRRRTS